MKQFYVLLFSLISLYDIKAQENASISLSGSYNVYPVDSVGVVLLNRNLRKLSNGDLALSFLGLNPQLEKKWENMYPFSSGLAPVFQQVTAAGIVILFSDKDGKRYEVIKANSEFGDYERFQYEFSQPVLIEELTYYYDNIWAAGTIGGLPSIFKLKPDNRFEVIPTGAPGLVKYAGQIHYNQQTKGFDFLLLAEVDKQDVLIWRSLSLTGNVLQNHMLKGFQKDKIKSVKATYTNSSALVAGTYNIGTRDRLEGVFWSEINGGNNQIKRNPMKSLVSLSNYREIADIQAEGFAETATNKFRSANKSYFIDNIEMDKKGSLTIAIEVFRPEFRSRTALEKEFIARDRVAQIDQNVFGRQDGLGAGLGRNLEERMDRASATDQIQYRFMDQSLGKAVNQGISYSHTAIVKLNKGLTLEEDFGVNFDLKDFGTLARSIHLVDNYLKYASGTALKQFDVATRMATIKEGVEGVQLVHWTKEAYLSVTFDPSAKLLKLSSSRLN